MNLKDYNQEKFVKEIINKAGREKAPGGLTDNIMNIISYEKKYQIGYSPLISKNVIFSVIIICIFIFTFTFIYSGGSSDTTAKHEFTNRITNTIYNTMSSLDITVPFIDILFFVASGLFILLLIDFLIRNKRLKKY